MTDNPFSKKNNTNNAFDEEVEERTVVDEEIDRKKKRTVIISTLTGISLVAIIGTIVGTGAIGGQSSSEDSSTKSSASAQSDGSSDSGSEGNGDDSYDDGADPALKVEKEFYEEEGKYFPVELDEWRYKVSSPGSTADGEANSENDSDSSGEEGEESSTNQTLNTGVVGENSVSDEVKTQIVETLMRSSSDIISASGILPSESSGYTSDDSKEYVDGSLNPDYSYWTAEVFQQDLGNSLERLLNPVYGGWQMYQYAENSPSSFDTSLVNDMFTNRFLEANAQKAPAEYIPVYADWAGNDYGMGDVLLQSGPRWFGDITSSTTVFTYNDEAMSYEADFTADIKFFAWDKERNTLEKNGKLKLKLVANNDNKGNSSHKVLIDEASLVVE